MKTTYILSINSKQAIAQYRLTYSKGYFKTLEKISGQVKDNQHKWLMNLVPQLEKVILILEMEWNEKGITWEKQEKNITGGLLKTMIDEYYSWYKEKFKIVPKINATEMKALKTIMQHLSRMASTEMEIIQVWNSIFHNWENLTTYYQGQTELRQINQNLNIILRAIKNETGESKYSR